MPEEKNKVTFGLRNAHYAVITEAAGVLTFTTPKPLKGSVELSLEPNGDATEFYADDEMYYSADNNQGYNGTLNIALIPQDFAEDCLGEEFDEESGTLAEVADAKPKAFALMFEFDGDQKAVRHVVYNCKASRPTVSSSTKTQSSDPSTSELGFKAKPTVFNGKRYVKNKTTPTTPVATYDDWYKEVFVPGSTPGAA